LFVQRTVSKRRKDLNRRDGGEGISEKAFRRLKKKELTERDPRPVGLKTPLKRKQRALRREREGEVAVGKCASLGRSADQLTNVYRGSHG